MRFLVKHWRGEVKKEAGFTLVEMLMAIAVVTLVLTAVVSGVSFSVRNTRVSKERAEAVRKGQEVIEWLLGQRNASGFKILYDTIYVDGAAVDYCLASLPDGVGQLSAHKGVCGPDNQIPGTNLTRQIHVVLTPGAVSGNADGGTVAAEVVMTWDEGGVDQMSKLRTEIKDWE